ncbi:MAG TPA: hypothetical protein VFX02_07725 [Gammaproteobacteria bacterium]|nr:hypothetical protein [Gammaproteobacteria bacterium]
MKKTILGLCMVIAATGCGVKMDITKANGISGTEICIVDNKSVKQDFRDAYERQIQQRGYTTKIVEAIDACPTATTYTATYGMHWGVYLATSILKIYSSGKEIGEARYEAPFSSPQKHGRVEDKIKAMVVKLLPRGK